MHPTNKCFQVPHTYSAFEVKIRAFQQCRLISKQEVISAGKLCLPDSQLGLLAGITLAGFKIAFSRSIGWGILQSYQMWA